MRRHWFEPNGETLNTKVARLRGRAPRGERLRAGLPHGRAPRGERLRASLPHGHWRTTTFVAGLRLDGIAAPMVINGAIFRVCIERVLVPTLRPSDIVVMDNLGSHKGAAVRAAIEAAGPSCASCRPTRPACASTRPDRRSPPSGPGRVLPRVLSRARQRLTLAALMPNRAAAIQ